MTKEELLYKYLNHELSADELKAFKQLNEYDYLFNLDENLVQFKAPEYDTKTEMGRLKSKTSISIKSKNIFATLTKIAAIFLVFFGIYFYVNSLDTTVKTLASQKQTIELPDGSVATLNALSQINYNKSDWKDKRFVDLEGEAYFDVAKGAIFKVLTDIGDVQVLGTEFNVKQRSNFFEVICYEGLVQVNYNEKELKLSLGHHFLVIDGKIIATEKESQNLPPWLSNYSQFKSMPYSEVIAEVERQYDVKIKLKSIDASQLFTGSFTHENMEVALKSITLPLHLTYYQEGNTITLKRE